MNKFIQRFAIGTSLVTVGLALFGVFFRGVLYKMLLSSGKSADSVEIIASLIMYGEILMALLAMVTGALLLWVPAWRNMRLAISVLVTSLITPPLYFILVSFIADAIK